MATRAIGITLKRDRLRARSAEPLIRHPDSRLPELGCALPQPAFATMEEVCRAHDLRLQLRAHFLSRVTAATAHGPSVSTDVVIRQGDDMRSMADCAFDDMNGVELLRDFASVPSVRYLNGMSGEENETESDRVWLECNAELVGACSVQLVGVRKSICDFETLVFICPRCGEPHESIRFR